MIDNWVEYDMLVQIMSKRPSLSFQLSRNKNPFTEGCVDTIATHPKYQDFDNVLIFDDEEKS